MLALVLVLNVSLSPLVLIGEVPTSDGYLDDGQEYVPSLGAPPILDPEFTTPAALSLGVGIMPFSVAPLGSGTALDPYLIETTENMQWLADLSDTTGLYFRLNQPVGTVIYVDFVIPMFSGTFDGNGRTIHVNINILNKGERECTSL